MSEPSLLRRWFAAALRGASSLSGPKGKGALLDAMQDVLDAEGRAAFPVVETPTPKGVLRLLCVGDLVRWRAATLLTKEPETIRWIENFDPGDVFWDVGANIGAYTLYAGISGDHRVLAFEPSAANYLILNRNIELNGLDPQVTAYCVALSDGDRVDVLHMQDTGFGQAMSSFGDNVGFDGARFEGRFLQGMVGFSVDAFIETFDPPFPNRIKIDVDGIEDRIIAGAERTLADPRVKALSVELDAHRPDYTDAVVARIEAAGLRFVGKFHDPENHVDAYAGIYNYHFARDPA